MCAMAVSLFVSSAIALDLKGELTQGSLIRGQVEAGMVVELDGKPLLTDNSGRFVFGFSRDDGKQHQLRWQTSSGQWQHKLLTPSQREYAIQHINGLPSKMVTPPHAVLERIRNDAVQVGKARSVLSNNDAVFSQFIWPAEGPISGVYGSQRILNGKPKNPHYGVDVAAPTGTKVIAPAAGTVTLADPDLYYSGGTLIIDHGMGVFSTFLHLSQIDVKVGDVVQQGEKIAEIGDTGRVTGPHLDWRLNWKKMRLDPALLVPPRD